MDPSVVTAVHRDFDLREKAVGPSTIRYIVCRPLESLGFFHAFSTRHGGVSPLPREALNLAYKNDTDANVAENRRRFLKALGVDDVSIVTARQTHSNRRQA